MTTTRKGKATKAASTTAVTRIVEWGLCGRALYIDISDATSQAKIAAMTARGIKRSAEPRIATAKGHRIIAALLEGADYSGSMPRIEMDRHGWCIVIEAEGDKDLAGIETALRAAAAHS